MPRVEFVTSETEAAALELLFADQPPAERLRSIADLLAERDEGRVSFAEMRVARDGDLVRGVLLAVPHGGTGRFVWPPVVVPGVGESTVDALLTSTIAEFRREGVELAQIVTETNDDRTHSRLTRNGFEHIADLEFMQRTLADPLPDIAPHCDVESYDPERNHARFEAMLEATYVGTLDCPGLDGRRSIAATLDGHRASGEFDPDRWRLFHANGTDVGLLLLADHPTDNAWEVVYIGVHHAQRGRGFGRELLVQGLRAARNAGRESMLLAVDTRNEYAIRTYVDLGFVPLVRRRVHVWFGDAR